MEINDPPAFSVLNRRMNRGKSLPGIKFLRLNICKFAKCAADCTLIAAICWLSGLLPSSRQLIKLNHFQHSQHLTST